MLNFFTKSTVRLLQCSDLKCFVSRQHEIGDTIVTKQEAIATMAMVRELTGLPVNKEWLDEVHRSTTNMKRELKLALLIHYVNVEHHARPHVNHDATKQRLGNMLSRSIKERSRVYTIPPQNDQIPF